VVKLLENPRVGTLLILRTTLHGDNVQVKSFSVKAAIGVFLTLEKPSKDMTTEATTFGFYHSPSWNKDFPKLQILTVDDLLSGRQVQLPPSLHTFKQAEKSPELNEQSEFKFE
jgi:site-specific DNA-methyltransferase (adenine-specific)